MEFDGGSFKNGTIVFDHTIIRSSNGDIFENCRFNGSISCDVNISWIKLFDNYNKNNIIYLQDFISCVENGYNVNWDKKDVYVVFNVTHHIHRLKDQNHMVILIYAEKGFDRMQHSFMTEHLTD